jgi:hypothetical protein
VSNRTTTSTHISGLGLRTFACAWCRSTVPAYAADGTPRNHCPACVQSRHVLDHVEGGRSDCAGRMSPIAVAVLGSGDWTVIHRCVRCDELTSNPVCADDNQLVLMRMAVRPLAQPPFPLEAFGAI